MSSCIAPTRSAGGSRTIEDPELTAADRRALLALARGAIAAALNGRPAPDLPDAPGAGLPRGAFVTLEEPDGALRGCIGRIAGDRPLGDVVRTVAVSAAREDPRFPAVAPDELPTLRIEISVLQEPVRAERVEPARLVIGRDGLLVRRGHAVGLLLPQVATEHALGAEAFLAAACRKAGLPPESWREPGTEVFTFQADVFGE
ncbi:MAG TPA: AmmeMemoRadiSam system protein A [Gemmatimonadales bacterium]|nr:AmmeMemoRadiSam system protein A [Gemmatimonadales bacterium]